jgi:hypothetical protein
MNFIFLITMIILMFSLVSSSMTATLKTTALFAASQKNQMDHLYSFNNQLEKDLYNQSKKREDPKSDTARALKRKGKRYTPRKGAFSENSKLNLYPLIDPAYTSGQKTLITNTFTQLIKNLYSKESFYKKREKLDPEFLDSFVKECITSLKKTKSLANITFSSQKNREFYLMMCKGAYPSKGTAIILLKYITLQNVQKEPPLVFPHLSAEVLTAFVGEALAQKIFKEEETLYFNGKSISRLNKEGVEKVLTGTHHTTHKSLLTYSHYSFEKVQSHTKGAKGTLIIKGPPVL